MQSLKAADNYIKATSDMILPAERKIRTEGFEQMFDSDKFLTSMKRPPVLTRFVSF